MKSVPRPLALLCMASILLVHANSKLIRPPSNRQLEDTAPKSVTLNTTTPVRLANTDSGADAKPNRSLSTEEDADASFEIPKKESLEVFYMKIKMFLQEEVYTFFGDVNISDEIKGERTVSQGGDIIFSYTAEMMADEDAQLEMVVMMFENDVVNAEISIEKTSLKAYVKRYLRTYVNNFFIKVSQTVTTVNQLATDLGQMLGYVLEEPKTSVNDYFNGMKPSKDEEQERRLNSADAMHLRKAMIPKIESHVTLKLHNLKDKKVFKNAEEVHKNVMNTKTDVAIAKEMKNEAKKAPARNLGGINKDGSLNKDNMRFVHDKKKMFKMGAIRDKEAVFLSLAQEPVKVGKTLKFRLMPSKQNLSEIIGQVEIINGDQGPVVEVEFLNASFYSKMTITIPTKRFIIKHVRNELDDITKLMEIIDQLNDLRLWRDCFPEESGLKHQYAVQELLDGELLYDMFRAEFDNMTDGMTEADQYGNTGRIQSKFEGGWDSPCHMLFFDTEQNPDEQKLIENITFFEDFGDDFMMLGYDGIFKIGGSTIFSGARRYPDASMFNQHFIALKYIMFQVEIAVRANNFTVVKDFITPFVTRAFQYGNLLDIPALRRPAPGQLEIGVQFAAKAVGAEPLEMFDPDAKLIIKMCPVKSAMYIDTIYWNGEGYSFVPARFMPRPEIDYCFTAQKIKITDSGPDDEPEGERRLTDLNVQVGALV